MTDVRADEHRLYLHYDFSVVDTAIDPLFTQPDERREQPRVIQTKFGALGRAAVGDIKNGVTKPPPPWPPSDILPALSARYWNEPVWKHYSPAVGKDLVDAIHQNFDPTGDFSRSVTLSDQARRLLDKADLYEQDAAPAQRISKRLSLCPSKAAWKRICSASGLSGLDRDAVTILIHVEDIYATLFRTGQGVATVVITVEPVVIEGKKPLPLEPIWLVETLHSLARFSTLMWRDAKTLAPIAGGEEFSFGWMIRSLLDARGVATEAQPFTRVFSTTYARLSGNIDDKARDELAFRLARHYTDDYSLVPDLPGLHGVRHFSTVGHYAASEGAATLLTTGTEEPPEFLKQYRTTTFELHYLPLIVLALHERSVHRDLTSRARFWPMARHEDGRRTQRRAELGLLADIAERRNRLRLCFRHHVVSSITMHNAFAAELKRALNLEISQRELDEDILAIRSDLEANAAHLHQRGWRWLTYIGTGAIVALATSSLLKEGFEATTKTGDQFAGLVIVGGALVAALVASGLAWWQDRSAPTASKHEGHAGGGHLMHHVAMDNIIHTASETN